MAKDALKAAGEAIKRAREAAGMSREDLATALGKDRSSITRLENGQIGARSRLPHDAARLLGLDEVFEPTGEPTAKELEFIELFRLLQREEQEAMRTLATSLVKDRAEPAQKSGAQVLAFRPQAKPPAETTRIRRLGLVAAGDALEAMRGPEEVDVPRDILAADFEHAALEVRGDSMDLEGIHDGDLVVFRYRAGEAWQKYSSGDMVVAQTEADPAATVKRYRLHRKRRYLVPRSSSAKHEPIEFTYDEWRILGVVVAHRDSEGNWHSVEHVRGAELDV